MSENKICLKPGREKSVLRHHPWIFSGAINKVEGEPPVGGTVRVVDNRGHALGWAAYSPQSSIRARMWTFNPEKTINEALIYDKLRIAIDFRSKLSLIDRENTACRLIHAESDDFPGLIVDRYKDALVVQFLSAGAEFWRKSIIKNIKDLTGCKGIYERSDVEVRKLEGLDPVTGTCFGSFETTQLEILENGIEFIVDVGKGQKTGFFLDQRKNRYLIQQFAKDNDVLNCFSYTGAFGIYALNAGAKHVTSVESSEEANLIARKNLILNGIDLNQAKLINADVFQELRLMRDKGLSFDVIILDPPKFAPTAAQVRSASRGYKDINLLAFKLLNPGGILFTFSCSGGLSRQLFQKIVADAALDAGVQAQILDILSQGRDHPVSVNFPEGAYLKGLICRIV